MRFKEILQKIPFGFLSLCCLGIYYFVGCTIGVLVVPVILCIIFVLPLGILFAILDIVIRKKKIVPIISLILCLWPIIGLTFMLVSMAFEFVKETIANYLA